MDRLLQEHFASTLLMTPKAFRSWRLAKPHLMPFNKAIFMGNIKRVLNAWLCSWPDPRVKHGFPSTLKQFEPLLHFLCNWMNPKTWRFFFYLNETNWTVLSVPLQVRWGCEGKTYKGDLTLFNILFYQKCNPFQIWWTSVKQDRIKIKDSMMVPTNPLSSALLNRHGYKR